MNYVSKVAAVAVLCGALSASADTSLQSWNTAQYSSQLVMAGLLKAVQQEGLTKCTNEIADAVRDLGVNASDLQGATWDRLFLLAHGNVADNDQAHDQRDFLFATLSEAGQEFVFKGLVLAFLDVSNKIESVKSIAQAVQYLVLHYNGKFKDDFKIVAQRFVQMAEEKSWIGLGNSFKKLADDPALSTQFKQHVLNNAACVGAVSKMGLISVIMLRIKRNQFHAGQIVPVS